MQAELKKNGILVDPGVSLSPENLQTLLDVVLAISPIFLLGSHPLVTVSIGKTKILEVVLNVACSFIHY